MRKSVVILISVGSLVFFSGLVYYGWTHRWGGTMDTTLEEPLVLAMPQMDKELTLQLDDFDACICCTRMMGNVCEMLLNNPEDV